MPTTVNLARLKHLSYSGIETFRRCPRKFELQKLLQEELVNEKNPDFAFGHSLGAALQKYLVTRSRDAAILEAFKFWDIALDEDKPSAYKSFPHVILGLNNFINEMAHEYDDWEVASFPYLNKETRIIEERKATELSFVIELPLGYLYRGYLDAVLVNKNTGTYRVLELKTTGARYVNEAMYKNSFQGVGYAVVLDKIAEFGYSDYAVNYLVYATGLQKYESLPFIKLRKDRISWLQDLLLTIEQLELYKRSKRYPLYGSACYAFGKVCPFFETCTYATDSILKGATIINEETTNLDSFDFKFKFEDLVSMQSDIKNESRNTI